MRKEERKKERKKRDEEKEGFIHKVKVRNEEKARRDGYAVIQKIHRLC
jgi:hypothetical protein